MIDGIQTHSPVSKLPVAPGEPRFAGGLICKIQKLQKIRTMKQMLVSDEREKQPSRPFGRPAVRPFCGVPAAMDYAGGAIMDSPTPPPYNPVP